MHIVGDALISIGLSVGGSLLLLWLVRRAIPHERLAPHNEVVGFVYAVVGVIYAVILGFVVISVWEQYREAEGTARGEADAVGNLYRLAEGLPEPSRQAIQEATLAYASAVVDEEWDAMAARSAPGQQAVDSLDALWANLYGVAPTTSAQEARYAAALEQMQILSAYRLERLEDAASGLLGILWAVMLGGGVVTVLFACVFGVENGQVHALMVAALAAMIGLVLFAVYDLNHPFRGDVHVQPEGFRLVLEQFGPPRP